MQRMFSSPVYAALAGLALCVVILGVWLADGGIDRLGFVSYVARLVHVLAAMIWVGMIWFVNFVQLAALAQADDSGRTALMKLVVPRVAAAFRHASHLTVASGVVLMMTTGYLLDRWVFPSAVYVPPFKLVMLYVAVAAALAMWAIVHFVIRPSLAVLLATDGPDAAAKERASGRIRAAARINLILALPVTCVMVAAAHL